MEKKIDFQRKKKKKQRKEESFVEREINEKKRDMREFSIRRSPRFLVFFSSIFLQFISGFSDDYPTPKNGTKADSHATSGRSRGTNVAIICLAILAVVILSFSLFKFWQKKKREEQYARLLKLFEEDDELELELGLRD